MEEAVAVHEDRKFKLVYTIIDRGADKKPFWLKLGIANVNRDGSLNVRLDAYPQNGTLHIRDYVPDEQRFRRDDTFGRRDDYRAQVAE